VGENAPTIMSDPARVSDAEAGAPGPRAPARQLFPLKVTVCAWCGKRSVEGMWDELDVVLHTFVTGRRHFITHSICPTCFEEHGRGTPYPQP
jgi:hypothetical protein